MPSILALLMFLTFTVDQIIQRTWHLFRKVRDDLRTKAKLRESVRSIFKAQFFPTMDAIDAIPYP